MGEPEHEPNGHVPHVPAGLVGDERLAMPTASLEVLWFLNQRGEQCYAYSTKGDIHYSQAIGDLTRIAHHFMHSDDDDEP